MEVIILKPTIKKRKELSDPEVFLGVESEVDNYYYVGGKNLLRLKGKL